MTKPVAIVLGGTNPHIELIKNLQNRGYYTILVDFYENPPAAEFADEHIRESTLNMEMVLDIAKRTSAKLVISTCVDHANVTACYVAEELGLPAPYSYETALKVTDKGVMKKVMLAGGIPTAKYIMVDNLSDPDISTLEFPVVVKPADATGSKGVRKATTTKEYKEYLTEALAISRSGEAIVEEFKVGIEIQADFFIKDKVSNLIMVRKKSKMESDGDAVLQSFGSVIPVELSEEAHAAVVRIAQQIAEVFELKNTSLFFQAIVNGDEVNVVEFAARVGGGLSYRMMQLIPEFDILSATVDSYLGLPVEISYKQPESYFSTVIIYAQPGTFDSVVGYDELIKENVIEEFFFFKTQGMEIREELTSNNRVGAFLIKADNKQDLLTKMGTAIQKLEIVSAEGNPIMRKGLYKDLRNEEL